MADHLRTAREALADALLEYVQPPLVPASEGRKQFFVGIVASAIGAACGETETLHEFVDTIIPGVRAAGISFADAMGAVAQAFMVLATHAPEEHRTWHYRFGRLFAVELASAWDPLVERSRPSRF